MKESLLKLLNTQAAYFNSPDFIATDPISVPHRFKKKQDIEIAGLFAALFAWGNRTTIINKTNELMKLMDDSPHQFILHYTDKELKTLLHFKHRTFNTTDLLYCLHFLRHHYSNHQSLETAFAEKKYTSDNIKEALIVFHEYFFSLPEAPARTRKHIATPARNSSCKRLCMYLRWMVRQDNNGVDFGIWKNIRPSQLICPMDVHVIRVAKKLGLLESEKANWQTAVELTRQLRTFDAADPVKYDFALFGMGVMKKM